MAQEGSQQPLSDDQMRRTWALVDILTLLKMRRNHPPPTVELIRRKYDALSLPALDTLSIMVDSAIQRNIVDLAHARFAAWCRP